MGRPKGSKNKKGSKERPPVVPLVKPQPTRRPMNKHLRMTADYVSKKLEQASVVPFAGDAHEYLMSIYKNTELPMPFRLDAAKACIPYEKPRLAAIAHKNVDDLPPLIEAIEYMVIQPDGQRIDLSDLQNQTAEDVEDEFEQQQSKRLEYTPYTEVEPEQSKPEQSEPDHAAETTGPGKAATFVGII